MLHVPGLSAYNFRYDNWGTNPAATPGTSVVPGASNAEGSWTQVASSANIAQDCYWIHVQVSNGSTSAAAKNHLLDIGVDPAGGTTYAAIISNIVCGTSPALTAAGIKEFLFPFFIKAGSSVAARVQGSNATAGTVRVSVRFYGQPSNPQAVPVGNIAQTFGTITNSNGTSFTPGNAADGTWVSLGTATTPLWWWQLGHQVDNATITAEYTYIDVGVGDGTNKRIIQRIMHGGTTAEIAARVLGNKTAIPEAFCPVPAGAEIWVRGRCNNAPDTGYNATVIGIGG